MNDEEWWAAARKAAKFWRKVKENQISGNLVEMRRGEVPTLKGATDEKKSVGRDANFETQRDQSPGVNSKGLL